ncbi:MAG: CPBP family intramembrane metalloprotease [Erysipelotrichaceae bacterium]|nr:CPBP family intramembrane metalloprotease [Erysipelotrichaceae bacterium]MBQ6494072.1 CPBP family intramembrane metalloprotease [Erysipelotrichaceae bacterium]
MAGKEHKVSRKYAKRCFGTIGLLLTMYALFVLIIPFFMHMYMLNVESDILDDKLLYYGIYFIIILFGTFVPFFLMRLIFKLKFGKFNSSISASFSDLFVQTIVFFTLCIALTYVSNLLFAYLGMEGKLISSIGFSYDEANLSYPLYIFMLIAVTPLIEEYAFRGVLLNTLSKYGKRFGLIASAVIFALAHLHFAEMLPAFAMGIQLGKTSLRYKSIQPTIIIHILFNALIYALCVIPASITKYMAFGIAAIVIMAGYLIISGRYERIKIQKLRSNRTTNILFYSSPAVIIAMMLMILDTLLFMYLK